MHYKEISVQKMATQYMYAQTSNYGGIGSSSQDGHSHSGGKNGNFAFKKRFEHIDWRKIAAIDIDQIARTLDFNALQDNVMNLTFCNIESELDMRMVDPNFIKLFKLAQFTIEYLLHSQDYLAGIVASSEEKVRLADEEKKNLKNDIEKLKVEMEEIKKESHKRKKLLIAQQQMMHSGADSYHKCPFCAKAFLNISFLQSHIFRRHHEMSSKASSTDAGISSGGSPNKTFEAEMKEIKERLQMTEAALKDERRFNRSLKNSLKDGDKISIMNANNEIQQREMDEMREMYEKELREVNQKLQASERAIVEVQYGGRSNFGDIEDDDDADDRRSIKRQREEVAILKEQLQNQMENVEKQMNNKLDKQERKWSKKVQNMTKQHAEELNKLNNALERTSQALVESQSKKKPEIERQHKENEELVRRSREQEKLLNSLEEELIKTEELRRSAEYERKQRERQEKILKANETVVETFINEKSRSPRLQSPARQQRKPEPKKILELSSKKPELSMYPSDEDDETTEMLTKTGTGSFITSDKGTTLGSTLGSTLNKGLNTKDFVSEIRKNQTMDIMKKELMSLVDEKLENIGVSPKLPGVSDTVRDNKLTFLKTHRATYERKYPDFARLRKHLDTHVTNLAKEKYRETKRTPPMMSRSLQNSRNASPAVSRHTGTFPQPTSSKGPSPCPRGSGPQQPVPTPRSSSPNKNMQSTGSTTEWTSTNWDSDESYEDDSDDDSLTKDVVPLAVSPPHTSAPRVIQSRPLNTPNNKEEEEDDWDSESEISEVPQQVNQPKVIVSRPKGENVSKLSQSIEMQLNSRGSNKKPVGAVDTMKSQDNNDFSDFDSDEDDDDAFKPTPQKRSNRLSSDISSNTYGTSQWGTSSKGVSSVNQDKTRPHSKSSFVSVTDVSSDEELDLGNI